MPAACHFCPAGSDRSSGWRSAADWLRLAGRRSGADKLGHPSSAGEGVFLGLVSNNITFLLLKFQLVDLVVPCTQLYLVLIFFKNILYRLLVGATRFQNCNCFSNYKRENYYLKYPGHEPQTWVCNWTLQFRRIQSRTWSFYR